MKIHELANLLAHYSYWYQIGQPLISDEEYDSLEEKLRQLDPKHPFLSKHIGHITRQLGGKIRLRIPMRSLAKTYTSEELRNFLKKSTEFVISDKIDGMALQLVYENGVLIQASTRGNGEVGESVLKQVRLVTHIPDYLNLDECPFLQNTTLIVMGELFFPLHIFEEYRAAFESPRNALVGTLGRKEIESAAPLLQQFAFQAYDLVSLTPDLSWALFWEKCLFLKKLGFDIGDSALTKPICLSDLEPLETFLDEHLHKYPRNYHFDGLVFRLNDEKKWQEWGFTAHHPRGSLAWKPSRKTEISRLKAIEVDVSRHGKLTFRAHLDPVQIAGAVIQHASLYSADFIRQNGFCIGDEVSIKRSGDVIPKIVHRIVPGDQLYELPQKCPCNEPVVWKGKDLFCTKTCSRHEQSKVLYYAQVLKIQGLGKQNVRKLFENQKMSRLSDLYTLTVEDLKTLEGFELKSAQNLIAEIQKTRTQEWWLFLTALGFDGLGTEKTKTLAQHYPNWESLKKINLEDMASWPGWGLISTQAFYESLQKQKGEIEKLLTYITIRSPLSSSTHWQGPVVITGTLTLPRAEWSQWLEQQGIEVSNTVTKQTAFLIIPDTPHESRKIEQAKAKGVPIITESEWKNWLKEKGFETPTNP